MIAARKIAGAALDKNGEETAALAISDVIRQLKLSPSITVSVAPEAHAEMERRLEQLRGKGIGGAITFVPDAAAKPGDWRVVWAEGSAGFTRAGIEAAIDAIITARLQDPVARSSTCFLPHQDTMSTNDLDLPDLAKSGVSVKSNPSSTSANGEDMRARVAADLRPVFDVPVSVQAVIGRTTMEVSKLLELGEGSVLELDRRVGEAIDIYVNSRLVARGEVVVVDDRLGVTMTEVMRSSDASRKPHACSDNRKSRGPVSAATKIAFDKGAKVLHAPRRRNGDGPAAHRTAGRHCHDRCSRRHRGAGCSHET